MNFVHYNKDTGQILGFYKKGESQLIPNPNIQVPDETKAEIQKTPHRFKILDGILQQTNPRKSTKLPPRKKVTEFKCNNFTYIVDDMLLHNISINLGLCSINPDHKCALWVKKDDDFTIEDHTKDMLVSAAEAYEAQRQKLMRE